MVRKIGIELTPVIDSLVELMVWGFGGWAGVNGRALTMGETVGAHSPVPVI